MNRYKRLKLNYKDVYDIDNFLNQYKVILITLDTLQDNYVNVHYGVDYYDDLQKMINKLHKFVKNY